LKQSKEEENKPAKHNLEKSGQDKKIIAKKGV